LGWKAEEVPSPGKHVMQVDHPSAEM
jgi:hypothetical protein